MRVPALLTLLLLAAPAAAQNPTPEGGAPKDPPSTQPAAQHPEPGTPISNRKLNAYIKGYNKLLSPFGLPAEARMYAAQQIARKGVNDNVNVSDGWLDIANDSFKKAQAIEGGGMPQVDAAASKLVPVLDRLVNRLKGLETYYQSRGNLEDHFARGKQEDPLVLADFKEALAEMDQLSDALDATIQRRDEADLGAMRDAGDMVGYDGGLALMKAKALLHLFEHGTNTRDPAALAKGDALVTELQAALEDERKWLDKAKTQPSSDADHAIRNSGYGIAIGQLQSMVGAYRTMKQSGQPAMVQMMVGAYNSAVESANIGQ